MVRHYIKKTNRGEISDNVMSKAVLLVYKKKKSLREAALEFGIKKSTLHDRVAKYKSKHGDYNTDSGNSECEDPVDIEGKFKNAYVTRQVFSDQEEDELAKYLTTSSKMQYGLSYSDTRKLAYEYAVQLKKEFPPSWNKEQEAGKDWMLGFMRRHKRLLSLRKPENTSIARATAFNKSNVDSFFTNLVKVQEKHKFTPDRILNLDETGISTVLQAPRVIAPFGQKQVGQVVSAERGILVTLVGIISAAGTSIPPIYIFPRVRLKEEYMYGAAPGAISRGSKSGWMTSELFPSVLQHIKNHTHCCNDNKILVILDNHGTHITLSAINFCRENGIILLSLPPHCTHRMQPLDVGVYGPFKSRCKTSFNDHIASNPGKAIRIQDIAKLTRDPYLQSFTPANIVKAFETSGIWPINRLKFGDDDFLAAKVTDKALAAKEDLPICETSYTDLNVVYNKESHDTAQYIFDILLDNVCELIKNLPEVLQDIRPYPKLVQSTTDEGRKKIRPKSGSKIYTESAEKNIIEEKELAKQLKESAKKVKRRVFSQRNDKDLPSTSSGGTNKQKKQTTRKKKTKKCDSSDSSDSPEVPIKKRSRFDISDDSDIDMGFEEDMTDEEISISPEVEAGKYILVKFATKKTVKHFVGIVKEIVKLNGETSYKTQFLRKKGDRGFVYPQVDDVSEVDMDQVVKILPMPLTIPGTNRQAGFLKFNVSFHNYHVQ